MPGGPQRPDLSVLVVTWNVAPLAAAAVARVLERCGALDVEVIVVDNASPDGTAERLRAAFAGEGRVQVMDAGANLGFPRANNLALDRARGRHVLFLNPDTEVGEGTLEACVAELDGDPSVGAVGCRLVGADGRVQPEGARRDYRIRHLVWEGLYLHVLFPRSRVFAHQLVPELDRTRTADVEALVGAFLMTRRTLALELGGLPDELFMYHEDLAYCLRVRRRGYRVRYRGDVSTLHHWRSSSSRSPAPLDLLQGEVRVRLIAERSGWWMGVAARAAFAFRQACRLLVSVPAACLPAVRRRYPQVAAVGVHARLLAWTAWPAAALGPLERGGVPRDERPGLLLIGPTPPPVHGVSAYVAMLGAHLPLRARFRVAHLDVADRRSLENLGRWDLRNVALGLVHLATLARILVTHRPRVTWLPISQNGAALLRDALLVALARTGGSRVVLHLHGGGLRAFHDSAGPAMRALLRWTVSGAARLWVLSEALRGQSEGLAPPARVRVVPNGVPDPRDEPTSPRPDAGARPFTVLHLGQLSADKGVDVLLDAVEALLGRGATLRVSVAGAWRGAADRERLLPRLDALVARGAAEVHGVVEGAAKARVFAQADVFALPTRYPIEGQPLAILEAMAHGLPVVATPRAAIPDMVVDGETGVLVPEGDAVALAAALARLAEDPALRARLGAAGRARFEAHFTAPAALDRATREMVDAAG